MKAQIYKQCLIVPRGGKIFIYDIANRVYAEAVDLKDAQNKIDARLAERWKKGIKRSLRQNPLTRAETHNLKSEARIHAKIGRTPQKKAYYRGVAEGMKDAAGQYSANPKHSFFIYQILWDGRLYKVFKTSQSRTAAEKIKEEFSRKYPDYSFIVFKDNEKRIVPKIFKHPPGPLHDVFAEYDENPPIKIYDRVQEIIAVKGPGHLCDSACKRARHTYRHKFTRQHKIYGNKDGSLTIR